MKKIIYLGLICCQIAFSQNRTIKTLLVSDNQNLLLSFESSIIQGICGHTNFKFAFDVNEQNTYGIVRGTKGENSTLHIITNDGNVYAFKLQFKDDISLFSAFIPASDAVGNINQNNTIDTPASTVLNIPEKIEIPKGIQKDTVAHYNGRTKTEIDYLYNRDRNEYYRKYCSNLIGQKPFYKRFYTENDDIVIYLDEINYNRNELYFKIRIKNNSGVDYTTNFISFSKTGRKAFKNSSSQALELSTVYSYYGFKTIPAGQEKTAIYVFQKFGINKDKVIDIELNESKGERNLNLIINSNYINNPK